MGVATATDDKAGVGLDSPPTETGCSTPAGDDEKSPSELFRKPSVMEFILDRARIPDNESSPSAIVTPHSSTLHVEYSAERRPSLFQILSGGLRAPARTRRKTAVKEDDLIRVY